MISDAQIEANVDSRLPETERQYMRSVLRAFPPRSRSNVYVYDANGVQHSNDFEHWRSGDFAQDVTLGGVAVGPSGERITLPNDLPTVVSSSRDGIRAQFVQRYRAAHRDQVAGAVIAAQAMSTNTLLQPSVTCPLSIVRNGVQPQYICGEPPTPRPTPTPSTNTPSTGVFPTVQVMDAGEVTPSSSVPTLQNGPCQNGGNNGPYRRVCSDQYGGYAGATAKVYLPCYATQSIQIPMRDTGYIYMGAFGAYGEGVDAGLFYRPGSGPGQAGDYVQFTLYTNSNSLPGHFSYISGAIFPCNQTVLMAWKYFNTGFAYTDPNSLAQFILDIVGQTEDGRNVSTILAGVQGYDTINYPGNYSYVKYKRMTTIAQNLGDNWNANESFGLDVVGNPTVAWSEPCLSSIRHPEIGGLRALSG